VEAPEVARVAAEVIRARARAEAASRKEERQKDLDQQQATSKNALDDAITDARVARADLSAARTLLLALGGVEGLPASPGSENERIASRVAVRSPIDGVISRRDATLGSAVQPERSLFEITSTGQVSTLIRWPESLPQVPRDGQRVQVRSRTAGESRSSCPAKVSGDVGPIDTTTRTRPIRVETTDACPWLVAGAFVTVDVPQTQTQGQGAPTTPAVTIPRRAVVDIHGVPSVFLAKEPLGEFVVRPVRLGPDLGDAVSVEAGLRAGERIAVGGAALLKGELLRSELAE
jgi:hypothetical protein